VRGGGKRLGRGKRMERLGRQKEAGEGDWLARERG